MIGIPLLKNLGSRVLPYLLSLTDHRPHGMIPIHGLELPNPHFPKIVCAPRQLMDRDRFQTVVFLTGKISHPTMFMSVRPLKVHARKVNILNSLIVNNTEKDYIIPLPLVGNSSFSQTKINQKNYFHQKLKTTLLDPYKTCYWTLLVLCPPNTVKAK